MATLEHVLNPAQCLLDDSLNFHCCPLGEEAFMDSPNHQEYRFECLANELGKSLVMSLFLLSTENETVRNHCTRAEHSSRGFLDGIQSLWRDQWVVRIGSILRFLAFWRIEADPHLFEFGHLELYDDFIITDSLYFYPPPKLDEFIS